jgi:putative tryptophan/tyrosine transport system substrate-binding protein
MRRREFVGLIGGSMVVWPVQVARSQPAGKPRKIGYLHPLTIDTHLSFLSSLLRRGHELGYVEGETILLRTAGGDLSRLPELVRELVSLDVGVLIVVGLPATMAARSAAPDTPVVAVDLETDPVKAGFVDSWAKPGRNLTGLYLDQASLTGKLVALMREVMPDLKKLALVWDPNTRTDQLEAARNAAAAAGFETRTLELTRPEEFSGAFARLEGGTGVLLLVSPALTGNAPLFATSALRYKLPNISIWKPIAKAGGLITYGPVLFDAYFPRAMSMADRILKGAAAGDIPIERPDRYELVLNMKTARQLGIEMPPTLGATADETIE